MLSTTAEYALRIMVVLTEAGARPVTSERIASITKVPADYAVKVLQMLARGRLVRAQRGRGGGFKIICDPARTTLLDVVNTIEPLKRITACPIDREEHAGALCPLHQRLDDVAGLLQDSLARMTLESLVGGTAGPALCPPPTLGVTVAASSADQS